MDSSSDDEDVFVHRKSSNKRVFESDDDNEDDSREITAEPTEDFKLHLSDEDDDVADIEAKIEASLAEPLKDPGSADGSSVIQTEIDEVQETGFDVSSDQSKQSNKSAIAQKSVNSSGGLGTADIMKKLSALADSDSESEEDSVSNERIMSKKSTLNSQLSDSNSDSENIDGLDHYSSKDCKPLKNVKTKSGPERKSKTNAKSAMLEIKAESQRQLRQSRIGLPYHIPKQRSLLDFLNRRKPTSSMPIKGPSEQLVSVWKQIEDREKEVEEFYKSESENESDTDDNSVAQTSDQQKENMNETELNETNSDVVLSKTQEGESKENVESMGDVYLSTVPFTKPSVDESKSGACDGSLTEQAIPSPCSVEEATSSVALCHPTENTVINVSSQATEESSAQAPIVLVDTVQGNESMKEVCHPDAVQNKDSHVTQDSQDMELHYSETQNLIETCISNEDDPTRKSCTDDSLSMTQLKGLTLDLPLKEKEAIVKTDCVKENCENRMKNTVTREQVEAAIKSADNQDEEYQDSFAEETSAGKVQASSAKRLSLKGDPNDVIDLDDISLNEPRVPGVRNLIERFMKHSSTKKSSKAQTVELSLISSEKDTSGGVVNVKHESVMVVLTGDDDLRQENITPGARLKLLKSELNQQMRKQKEEEWQKKLEEMKNEKVFKGEKDDCGMSPDEEEEEEEEMTDSEAESEPEINDIREPKRKKRAKNAFVDEEAEVEDEENNESSVGGGNDKGCGNDDEDESDEESVGEKDVEDDDNDEDDDSDSDDEDCEANDDAQLSEESTIACGADNKNNEGGSQSKLTSHTSTEGGLIEENSGDISKSFCRSMTTDLFASQSNEYEDDDFIPAGQPKGVARDHSWTQKPDELKDRTLDFSLMSLSIPGKGVSFSDADREITPTKYRCTVGSKSSSGIKQLFNESEPANTQEKLAELSGLFAEKFKDSEEDIPGLTNIVSSAESETDLMALCSGKFVTQIPLNEGLEDEVDPKTESQFSTQTSNLKESQTSTFLAEDSVDFSLKWDGDTKNSEDLHDGEKNSDSTEKFRLEIMSSDEDDTVMDSSIKRKKKNRKLDFSDDEEEYQGSEDVRSLGSDLSELENNDDIKNTENEKLFGVFSKSAKEVFYDSDENEIEPGDFLEKEAELSEEEDWQGSEDEDEKGLDQLEMDEADKEDIDQDLVREQLVQNHMQKMLDEDRRDVRILQEMLLEDGELHSDTGGRERQFRWRNVDSSGMGDDARASDDENADQEEDEDDAEWRKQRHEREMFLREQREKQKKDAETAEDKDEVLENSELLQLGKSILLKSRSSSLEMSSSKECPPAKLALHNKLLSPDGKRPNLLLSKRGSFLSRGDNVLAKLAKLTGSAKENVLAGAKTSGNFVFSAISPTKKQSQSEEDFDIKAPKRKASVALGNPSEKKPCIVGPVKKTSGLFDHL